MAVGPEDFADVDKGISYDATTNAVRTLLNKVKARKRTMMKDYFRVHGDSDYLAERSIASLSEKLDQMIQFGYKEYPKTVLQSSWRKWKKPMLSYKGRVEEKLGKAGWNVADKAQVDTRPTWDRPGKYFTPSEVAKREAKYPWRPFSSLLDSLIEFQGDPRPRNNLGEFTDQAEGGPNPNSMYKTYTVAPQTPGMAPNKSTNALVQGGALALVGGAAGAAGAHGYKSLASWVKRTARGRK